MNKLLNELQMKFVRIVMTTVTILSIYSLAISIWLVLTQKNFEDKTILFPFIFGICCLSNVFKFNNLLKINKGNISAFELKCLLLSLGRGALISLTYLCISLHDISQSIAFAIFTLFLVVVEIIMRKYELEK